ncbi:MAG TPA: sigma-70 family RNA polymerase sigma factor [Polyangiaceae bacterium LLY-WYZ-15_(1-7)]|nr:sigma-70 family RNA polymerase sigma factor [Polyangiaceae bacterium LLY-WYZ-15_(1-7)]HJL02223.1 sigma-70 family RNA polymerase sigma factor [Polyangiaceae bacterium LLY-WYZ-15_(1-7)]HJL13303.1 sigma-70 family RNA polymerase sigma factor [Polyangiaceae bacterium LLY-WYZ-15_(1-7)]HJL22254.1 sigma-70 family RNA polymerase sigma factor [Polyangiaceae bacterium LLY-WYZ-15_(1-7)]HJL38091.1 sigma-70 family RNA polymerase sigma factor [Polyangiaceae bacterium LLY-WYZ-15_(1-7)]
MVGPGSSPGRETIDAALAGDAAAMRALVDALTPVIQATVARALLPAARSGRGIRADVEDLTQEVFERLLENGGRTLASWDPARGRTLRGFVRLVAQRHVATVLRSRRRSPYAEEPVAPQVLELPSARAERLVTARSTMRAIHAGLRERLSPKGLRVYELLLCRGLPADEVAAELGMSRGAVYMWRTRIRQAAQEIASGAERTPAGEGAG